MASTWGPHCLARGIARLTRLPHDQPHTTSDTKHPIRHTHRTPDTRHMPPTHTTAHTVQITGVSQWRGAGGGVRGVGGTSHAKVDVSGLWPWGVGGGGWGGVVRAPFLPPPFWAPVTGTPDGLTGEVGRGVLRCPNQGFSQPPGGGGGEGAGGDLRDPPTTDFWQTHRPTNVPPSRGGGVYWTTTHPHQLPQAKCLTTGKMP